jgi:eukaryotic-like serine/threonine-protein kinase
VAGTENHLAGSVDSRTRSVVATYSEPLTPATPAELLLGQTIGRYHVRRLLGSGGMGHVYLARDNVIGRAVALKIVSSAVDNERFLREAATTGMLNHPHVVQLYDFGAFERGMFLALEYVEGDTLRERMRLGAIGLDEVLRYVRAIADALAHAHAAGVFHCDLKPSNVVVGRDGRLRVVDFGIARTVGDGLDVRSGTEGWMAPEQVRGAALTDRVDVWALAIVTAQLLTGAHPLGDDPACRREAMSDASRRVRLALGSCHAPAIVIDLIARSLAHAAGERPSAADWRSILDDVIAGGGRALGEDAPYPGLAAFDEQHARFYFGRERDIDEFLERLRDAPHLPIVGPSGTGKSSFLFAGVIPRLRARERWTVIAFRPGSDPVGALARHVLQAMPDDRDVAVHGALEEQTRRFRDELLESPALLAVRLATLAAACGGAVLLAVDQLEEAFTQCASERERDGFLACLLVAADDPLDPVRLVVTVRDDFLGKLAGLRTLFVLRELDAEALRRTITGPLERSEYQLDDLAIVDDLIAEVGSAEVADLPLLQFACRTLWEGRDVARRVLRRETYREMGGLAGALAQHAERALGRLTPDERRIARQVLLQLVSGTTRRSVARSRLVDVVGADANVVVDRLLEARLLVQRAQADSDGSLVEIAHESLLRTWSQLARWVDESRDERRLLEELQDAASLWERRGSRSEETWSQNDLVTARHRAAQLGLVLPPSVQAFLTAGEQRYRAQLRKRRFRLGMALASAALVAAVAFLLIGRILTREAHIDSNMGTIDLVLEPFDWIDGAPSPVAVDRFPALEWQLFSARPDNSYEPDKPLPENLVEVIGESRAGTRRTWRALAPGGLAFLRIDGRGQGDDHCPPSWIRLQSLPGYAGAAGAEQLPIQVPTCQATRADMVVVPAGAFIYGGAGEQAARLYDKDPDYTEPERTIDLPEFAIDRTEVSNAAYALFGRLAQITGYRSPIYSNDPVHVHDGEPNYPVNEVHAYQAEAYCHYLGKQLPSDYQWVKAARGGLEVNGLKNPYPRRLYPWGPVDAPECANRAGLQDGYRWVSPVTAFPCGASPYGVLNLAGNADEWISRAGQTDAENPHHAIRGGSAYSPLELEHSTTVFRNHRDPLKMEYGLGFRCVSQ